MVEFKRNKKTGTLEAYENGKIIGKVLTMGDEITEEYKDKRKKPVKRDYTRRKAHE